jgi:cytochrome c553
MRYDSSCGPPVPTIARCARNLITLARSDEPSALAAIKEVADRMDGKTRQEAEVTLRNAVARELSDDDLAAIAIGSAHEESQEDRKSDPSKLN